MEITMKKFARRNISTASSTKWLMASVLISVVLMIGGCGGSGSPDSNDGQVINEIVLPTDLLLNLNCANVGVAFETCIEEDPENPFRTVTILEFDVNNPDAEIKFDLANQIPAGPTGAKARFYLWATALARRASGENQYYTALAQQDD